MGGKFYQLSFLLSHTFVFKHMACLCRFSGAYPDGVAGWLSYANSPRIVIFTSDGSNTRQGFEITFRKELPSLPVEQLSKRSNQKRNVHACMCYCFVIYNFILAVPAQITQQYLKTASASLPSRHRSQTFGKGSACVLKLLPLLWAEMNQPSSLTKLMVRSSTPNRGFAAWMTECWMSSSWPPRIISKFLTWKRNLAMMLCTFLPFLLTIEIIM